MALIVSALANSRLLSSGILSTQSSSEKPHGLKLGARMPHYGAGELDRNHIPIQELSQATQPEYIDDCYCSNRCCPCLPGRARTRACSSGPKRQGCKTSRIRERHSLTGVNFGAGGPCYDPNDLHCDPGPCTTVGVFFWFSLPERIRPRVDAYTRRRVIFGCKVTYLSVAQLSHCKGRVARWLGTL